MIPALEQMDVGAAYRQVRGRITEFTSPLDAKGWERTVPHCPDWTVRETVAHLTGIVDDALNNNMTGVATDAWTAKQVAKRAAMSGPEILDEWNTYGPFVDARASQVGLGLGQLLFDAVNHEHDLRHAIGVPGARDTDALWVGAAFVSSWLPTRLADSGVAPLGVVVDGRRLTPESALELRTSVFDFVRSFGSRRSLSQIARLDWSTPPDAQRIRSVLPFTPPAQDLHE